MHLWLALVRCHFGPEPRLGLCQVSFVFLSEPASTHHYWRRPLGIPTNHVFNWTPTGIPTTADVPGMPTNPSGRTGVRRPVLHHSVLRLDRLRNALRHDRPRSVPRRDPQPGRRPRLVLTNSLIQSIRENVPFQNCKFLVTRLRMLSKTAWAGE